MPVWPVIVIAVNRVFSRGKLVELKSSRPDRGIDIVAPISSKQISREPISFRRFHGGQDCVLFWLAKIIQTINTLCLQRFLDIDYIEELNFVISFVLVCFGYSIFNAPTDKNRGK